MGDDGEFFGFIGAQKVTYNAIDLIWNTYFKKNAEGLVKYVPTEYNNITIDEKNFIYVTISSIDPADQQSAITSKSKSGGAVPEHIHQEIMLRSRNSTLPAPTS